MKLDFVKTSPTQNMTLLLTTPVPREKQPALAERLIAYDSVYAEQAGFLEAPEDKRASVHLQMMAGEFCGNATLSAAAWLMEREGLPAGSEKEFLLEVSGAAKLIACKMKRTEEDFVGTVEMPLPEKISEKRFLLAGKEYKLTAVEFEGITHIIVPKALWQGEERELAELAAKEWAGEMPEAFGILLFSESTMELTPLVCVQGHSLVWERGCGSGTSAVGAFLAGREKKNVSVSLKQPGGEMAVSAAYENGKIISLRITGHVRIAAVGTAYL